MVEVEVGANCNYHEHEFSHVIAMGSPGNEISLALGLLSGQSIT